VASVSAIPAGERDELLQERARTGLWLCFTSITLFDLSDQCLHPGLLAPIYAIKGWGGGGA